LSIPDAVISVISGLLGAIVGGLLTIRASLKAVEKTAADLEATEIRKQKIDCLVAVGGLRFVIGAGFAASIDYRLRWMYEMNKIVVLWSGDQEVVNNVRDILNSSTDEKMVKLIRSMGRSTSLPLTNLADADLTRVMMIPLTGAPPIITPPPQ
jgi:hypothetical protein